MVIKQTGHVLSLQPKDECVKAAFEIIHSLGADKWVGFNDGSLAKMRQVKSLDRTVPVLLDRDAKGAT
jgi:glycerophosphoryl diester phosphodiesterase